MPLNETLLFRQALQRSAREWLKIYREELQKVRPHGLGSDGSPKSQFSPVSSNSIATEQILDANYEITKDDTGNYDIVIGLPGYILAIDQGVRPSSKYGNKKSTGRRGGTSPFIKSLTEWIRTKNIQTELSTLSLAFAIRTNILNKGIEKTDILSKINERFAQEFDKEISDGYYVAMEDYIINNVQRIEERFR
jgi:hypothetical protein